MEESGSEGLDDLINAEAGLGKFFDGVDCVCIVRFCVVQVSFICLQLLKSDNYWLNTRTVSPYRSGLEQKVLN